VTYGHSSPRRSRSRGRAEKEKTDRPDHWGRRRFDRPDCGHCAGHALFHRLNPKPPVDPEAAAEAADAHGGGHGDKKGDSKPGKKAKDSPELTRFEYTYMQIEREFLVNVSGSKKVMSVQLAVMTHYDDRVFENVKKHDFAIRSAVMDVMRLTTDADLVKPDFRKELAAKIRDAINSLLEKYEDFGGIEEIHFTNFIVQ
jgi:flagellar FliL protein